MKCKKCGCKRISGPSYAGPGINNNPEESLEYQCGQCGFIWNLPTLDRFDPTEIQKEFFRNIEEGKKMKIPRVLSKVRMFFSDSSTSDNDSGRAE